MFAVVLLFLALFGGCLTGLGNVTNEIGSTTSIDNMTSGNTTMMPTDIFDHRVTRIENTTNFSTHDTRQEEIDYVFPALTVLFWILWFSALYLVIKFTPTD